MQVLTTAPPPLLFPQVSETILQGSLRLQSPEFTLESPLLEMPFYLGLGVLAGALAILVREARTASDDD